MDVPETNHVSKPAFEPSELVDHGLASELTQGATGTGADGGIYS